MGVRFPFAVSNTVLTPSIGTTVESLVATSPPITPSQDFAQILVMCYFNISPGSSATSYLVRVYRAATITTPIYSSGNLTDSLTSKMQRTFFFLDTPSAFGPVQYSFTYQTVAGVGNSLVADAVIAVLAL